jgi:hypothetical protein
VSQAGQPGRIDPLAGRNGAVTPAGPQRREGIDRGGPGPTADNAPKTRPHPVSGRGEVSGTRPEEPVDAAQLT